MMPDNVFSITPLPSPYLTPRTTPRYNAAHGTVDTHLGGVALSDASKGIVFQLWTCFTDGINIWLSAPNTAAFIILPNVNALWVALAFDQSSIVTIAYVDNQSRLFYYWFDSTISGFRTSQVAGSYSRVFASLDDNRVQELTSSDVIIAYQRAGSVYSIQQRDRFGVEYTLGAAPGTLVQLGMNLKFRIQFAFQSIQNSGRADVPPVEYQQNVGGVLNVP